MPTHVKTCFVSMPLGTRQDPQTGMVVDFDRLYEEVLEPAIAAAELEMRSWRTGGAGAATQKQALSDVMTCDVLVADISTFNPNVMYELGVRHAANRGPTVLMMARNIKPPFYVGFLETVLYDPVADLAQPDSLRQRLAQVLRAAGRRSEGSPIYEFFPTMRVELPEDLGDWARQGRAYPEHLKRVLAPSRRSSAPQTRTRSIEVAEAETTLRAAGDAAPAAYLDLLRGYRDAGDWDRLIAAADDLPLDVREDPQTLQLLALALNRRSKPGDQDRAIALMHTLVGDTGGDTETLAILGRLYKDRWKTDGDPVALQKAAEYYRRGFELQPTDYYSGFNAASLLFMQNDPQADVQVGSLLPRVKEAIQPELQRREISYWTRATAIEIAVMERSWPEAQAQLDAALASAPMRAMRTTSAESIERLGRRFQGADAAALASLVAALRQSDADDPDDPATMNDANPSRELNR